MPKGLATEVVAEMDEDDVAMWDVNMRRDLGGRVDCHAGCDRA